MDFLVGLFLKFSFNNPLLLGLYGGIVITLFNTIGALLIFLFKRISQKIFDTLLGFAAGVMLTASFTSLILPGIEIGGILPVLLGILIGSFTMDLVDKTLPHMHFIKGGEGIKPERLKAAWLFVIAISIHNIPEGLSVGVGLGSGNLKNAIILMMAIGLQNIPEGFSAAISSLNAGLGKNFYAAIVGIRAGLIEIPFAIFGAWAVSMIKNILPYAMGFAAGAMLYIISDEIIPETHRKGHERNATLGTILGIIIMLYLDVSLS